MPATVRIVLLVLACLTVGCGDPAPVPIHGTVTLDGQPLTSGDLVFQRAAAGSAEQVIGNAQLDASGKYTVYCKGKEGLPPGTYKVVVTSSEPSNPKDPYSMPVSKVNKKFTELGATPLTVQVPGSAEQFNLAVTK